MRALGVIVLLLAWVAVPGDAAASRLARTRGKVRAPALARLVPRRPTRRPGRRPRLLRPAAAAPPSKIQTLRRAVAPNRRMSDISIAALTLAGARGVGRTGRARVPLYLDVVTGVGGVVLSVASIIDYRRALDGPGKVDAAHGLAWGLQSVGGVVARITGTGWLASASTWLGVGGGALQTGVGLYRLKDGIARRDRRVTILGALDVVAGVSWVASTVSFNPLAVGVFLGATGVRVIYANADEWKRAAGHVLRGAGRLLGLSSRPRAEAGSAAESPEPAR